MARVVLLALPVWFLGGCTREGEMIAFAATDLQCPAESVHVLEQRGDINEPTWEVEACGRRARYTCHDRQRGSTDPASRRGACERDVVYPDKGSR